MEAGTWKAIRYQLFKLVDEILHSLDGVDAIGNAQWRYKFCQWSHRYE